MRCRPLACALAALLFLGSGPAGAEPVFAEDEVKAAFLFSFTRYLEWPAARFADARSPIGIGLYCAESMRGVLQQIVRGREVNGRGIEVSTLDRPDDARRQHLVFVCSEGEDQLAAILRAVQGAAVVVVGESDRFWQAGGTINLVPVGDKLRFNIDMAAASRAGVKVSAQLQKLALTLERPGAAP